MIDLAVLAASAGFAATVWTLLFAHSLRYKRKLDTFLYGLLAVVNAASLLILAIEIIGRHIDLADGLSLFILAVLIGVPPLILFLNWLRTKNVSSRL